MCVGACVWVLSVQVWSLHRCTGVFAYVWGDLNHIHIPLYKAITIFHPPLHSSSLPHTISSFCVFYSSSLFISLHLVIVHQTTQRCSNLSISSKRWRHTTLNMLRVLHTFPSHTLGDTNSDMMPPSQSHNIDPCYVIPAHFILSYVHTSITITFL